MSINQLFELSRRSFRALDAAMNTTGQNVANADTEGYARRRVVLTPEGVSGPGMWSKPAGVLSTAGGVSVSSIDRMRDQLLLRAGWESRSTLGLAEEDQRVAGALEGLFPTHSAGTLAQQLNAFWNAWGDLADNPADISARQALRGKAESFTSTISRLDEEIRQLQSQTDAALTNHVEEANRLIQRAYDLNQNVIAANHRGSPDLEAEDERDRVISKLAEFAQVRVNDGPGGSLVVRIDGVNVVEEHNVTKLRIDRSGDAPRVLFGDSQIEMRADPVSGGRIGGLIINLTETLPNTIASLDELAATLVQQVNALHTTGYGLNGATGNNFFDPAGTTARSMAVNQSIRDDVTNIAASQGDPSQGYNDSTIALGIAQLRDAKLFNSGTDTSEGFVVDLVTDIGAKVDRATSRYKAQAAYAQHLEAMERGVSAVSIEEEMTALIQYQHSFQASARVLNTAQEMIDVLLAL